MSAPPRSRRDNLTQLAAQFRPDTDDTDPDPGAPAEATTSPAPTEGASVKTTLSLPAETAQRLRTWAAARRTSHADIILTALLERGDALAQRCASETDRVALGLPSRLGRGAGERSTITIRLAAAALDALDDTARRYGMTRSALAAVLIDLETGG